MSLRRYVVVITVFQATPRFHSLRELWYYAPNQNGKFYKTDRINGIHYSLA